MSDIVIEDDPEVIEVVTSVETAKEPTKDTVERPTREARYTYDFGLLKRRERGDFFKDMDRIRKAGKDVETEEVDSAIVRWMRILLVGFPDGCDFRKEEIYTDISAIEWDDAVEDFGYQFLRDYANKPRRPKQ